jgi:predicted amidophosphoribosyltransferase
VIDVIARKRETISQQNLTRIERQHNLQGAFVIQRAIPFQHVALVDDVLTTGSTANEISQLLLQHGVHTVQLWAIARTPESPEKSNSLASIR